MGDPLLSSFGFIVPSTGCLSAFLFKGLAQRFPCEFQQGKLHIHCMGDSLLSSFGFIVPSPGCLTALPVTPLQAAFLVEAPQTNPDRFTGTTQRLRSCD
jgi:hypothetical protein